MNRRILLGLLAVLVAAGAAGGWWWYGRAAAPPRELLIFGNVDLRQIDLAFNGSERIAAVLVEEGDLVRKGQPLARLDTRRLEPQVAQARAQVSAQRAVVERLHHGSRPEEIAQARALLDSARADEVNARQQYERLTNLAALSNGRAASRQDLDNAKAVLDVAAARAVNSQKALDLALAGPRKEDIAQGEAQLQGDEAHLALLLQQLGDAELLAPADAVVRSRLMEPGEMASPQRSVLTLAVIDPKWVRAYVSGRDLGRIHPGEQASVNVDSFADRRFEGWIGFISPTAEFTPKTVETEELRSSLVYEVRVFVKDGGDLLRLGMPATVHLPLGQEGGAASGVPKGPGP